MASRKKKYVDPTPERARKILKAGKANGKKLTRRQKRYFTKIGNQ